MNADVTMKRLTEDDRDVLILRLVLAMPTSHHFQQGRFAAVDALLYDRPGYATMTDGELIHEATVRNVSLKGIDVVESDTAPPARGYLAWFLRTLVVQAEGRS